MKTPIEKLLALLGTGLLAVTLSACGGGESETDPGSEPSPHGQEVEQQNDDGGGGY